MKVIVNVDDYCYSKSQVDGTIYAYQNGVVTSTTCMANMRDELLEYGVAKSNENPGLGIGCHLNLTYGKPLTQNKTLTHPSGRFFKQNEYDFNKIDPEEVYLEFKAQIDRFIKFFGRKPTHLDSHHLDYPRMDTNGIRYIVERLRQEYDLPYGRMASKDIHYAGSPYGHFDYDSFTNLILEYKNTGCACIEIGCHAAFIDQELYENSSYNYQRIQELKVLTSPEVKKFYEDQKIEKVHY